MIEVAFRERERGLEGKQCLGATNSTGGRSRRLLNLLKEVLCGAEPDGLFRAGFLICNTGSEESTCYSRGMSDSGQG